MPCTKGSAERCSSLATAFEQLAPKRLSVVPSTKWGLERETGLEPATFSLEGLSGYAQQGPSWRGERNVSSYRVVDLVPAAPSSRWQSRATNQDCSRKGLEQPAPSTAKAS
jgi:hypothetical protein